MFEKMFQILLCLLALSCVVVVGCGGGSSDSDPAPPPDAVSLTADPVEVGKGSPSLITAGLKEEIEVKPNHQVFFELSVNPSGATIESADPMTDEQGKARAIYRAGSTGGTDVVRVRIPPYGDATVNIKVYDVDPVRQSLTISADPNQVEMNGVSTITAILTDADGPIPGVPGQFSFINNESSARLTDIDRSTDVNGKISANYRAGNRPGVDVIKVAFNPSLAATVNITVDNPTATITVSPTSLPEAEQYVPYSSLLTASGGRPDYRFSVAPGSAMPPGVTLSSNGVVTGNATAMIPGAYSFVVQVQDSAGRVKLQTITLTVKEPSSDLSITTTEVDDATIGIEYNARLEASGGRAPYTWSFVSGSAKPDWIGIISDTSGTGLLSGLPAPPPGTTTLMIQVQDQNGVSASKGIPITVVAPTSTLKITSTSLTEATIGQEDYNDQLEATGGRTPYTWSQASGSTLPTWLSLASNGVVSSRKVEGPAGEVSFIAQVTDADGESTTARITITVQ